MNTHMAPTLGPVICVKAGLDWLPPGGQLRVIQGDRLPPQELITGVHVYCFSGQDLLLVKHEKRGWDMPGGHLERGESLLPALARELAEEGDATAKNFKQLALLEVDVSAGVPIGYRYPAPKSYMVAYTAEVDQLLPFKAYFETVERRLFSPAEVRQLEWYSSHKEVYELALARQQS